MAFIPNIGQQIGSGIQSFGELQRLQSDRDQQANQLAKNAQFQGLRDAAFTQAPEQANQSIGGGQSPLAAQQLGLGQQAKPMGQTSIGRPALSQAQSLAQLAIQFPEKFEEINKNLGLISQQQKDEASSFSFDLINTPFNQRAVKITERVDLLRSQGRNADDTEGLLTMLEQDQNQSLEAVQIATLGAKDRIDLSQPDKPTTLMQNILATGLSQDSVEFQTAMKDALAKEVKVDSLTSLQKNLVASGFEVGTPEFQAAVQKQLNKPGLVIDLGQKGGIEEAKALAKSRVQRFDNIVAKGDEAQEQLSSLDILDSTDVGTGIFEPFKQSLAEFGEGFGIDTSGLANVAAGQAFTAEAGKVVLRIMATQKGPQTDNDRKNIAKTVSRLGNVPEANVFINSSARAIARRAIEQRNFYQSFLEQNEKLGGASTSWNSFKRDTPMVSQFVKTPNGLPVFFFEFKDTVQNANPGASDADILEAWRSQEAAAKGSK